MKVTEVQFSQGAITDEDCSEIGITGQTYYHWREECSNIQWEQVKRLKELEKENARLKILVANLEAGLYWGYMECMSESDGCQTNTINSWHTLV